MYTPADYSRIRAERRLPGIRIPGRRHPLRTSDLHALMLRMNKCNVQLGANLTPPDIVPLGI
jgi:hypothetical protein